MDDILCKIWRFLSNILGQVVDFIANTLTTIGTAVVDVLSDLLQAAGSAIGDIFSVNPLLWVGIGALGLWWLFGGDDDEDRQQPSSATKARNQVKGSKNG